MSLKVGLVDDDEGVRRSLARLLRHSGMSPTTFASAQEFLESPQREKFDCLVVDIYLEGGVTGFELKERLNEQHSRIPVIFFSAHDDAKVVAEAARVGCHAFCSKGQSLNLLLDALRTVRASSDD